MAYQLSSAVTGVFGKVFNSEAEAEAHRQELIEAAHMIRPTLAKMRGEFPANPREFFTVVQVELDHEPMSEGE